MRGTLGVLLLAACVAAGGASSELWQSPAKLHRFLRKSVRGTLIVNTDDLIFRSPHFIRRWAFPEIHTFNLSLRELTLTTYKNRPWHEPRVRRYRFTLGGPIPAGVASTLAARVAKPSRNGVPAESAAACAEIPAHLRTRFGGSNGTLRFRDGGIDYVTEDGHDARSWRWADIQTIANPNPYALRVTGYREIAEFDLKRPLPRAVFERLWDRLYGTGLNLSATKEASR